MSPFHIPYRSLLWCWAGFPYKQQSSRRSPCHSISLCLKAYSFIFISIQRSLKCKRKWNNRKKNWLCFLLCLSVCLPNTSLNIPRDYHKIIQSNRADILSKKKDKIIPYHLQQIWTELLLSENLTYWTHGQFLIVLPRGRNHLIDKDDEGSGQHSLSQALDGAWHLCLAWVELVDISIYPEIFDVIMN